MPYYTTMGCSWQKEASGQQSAVSLQRSGVCGHDVLA